MAHRLHQYWLAFSDSLMRQVTTLTLTLLQLPPAPRSWSASHFMALSDPAGAWWRKWLLSVHFRDLVTDLLLSTPSLSESVGASPVEAKQSLEEEEKTEDSHVEQTTFPDFIRTLFKSCTNVWEVRSKAYQTQTNNNLEKKSEDGSDGVCVAVLEYLRITHSFSLLCGLAARASVQAFKREMVEKVLRLSATVLSSLATPPPVLASLPKEKSQKKPRGSHASGLLAKADDSLANTLSHFLSQYIAAFPVDTLLRSSSYATELHVSSDEKEPPWMSDSAAFIELGHNAREVPTTVRSSTVHWHEDVLPVLIYPLVRLTQRLLSLSDDKSRPKVSLRLSIQEAVVGRYISRVLVTQAQQSVQGAGSLAQGPLWTSISSIFKRLLPECLQGTYRVCEWALLDTLVVLVREGWKGFAIWDEQHGQELLTILCLTEQRLTLHSPGAKHIDRLLALVHDALLHGLTIPQVAQYFFVLGPAVDSEHIARKGTITRVLDAWVICHAHHLTIREPLLLPQLSERPHVFPAPAEHPLREALADHPLSLKVPLVLAWVNVTGLRALLKCGFVRLLFALLKHRLSDPDLTLASCLEAPHCRSLRPLHTLQAILNSPWCLEVWQDRSGLAADLWKHLTDFFRATDVTSSRREPEGKKIHAVPLLHHQDAHQLGLLLLRSLCGSPAHVCWLQQKLGVLSHLDEIQRAHVTSADQPELIVDALSLLRAEILAQYSWLLDEPESSISTIPLFKPIVHNNNKQHNISLSSYSHIEHQTQAHLLFRELCEQLPPNTNDLDTSALRAALASARIHTKAKADVSLEWHTWAKRLWHVLELSTGQQTLKSEKAASMHTTKTEEDLKTSWATSTFAVAREGVRRMCLNVSPHADWFTISICTLFSLAAAEHPSISSNPETILRALGNRGDIIGSVWPAWEQAYIAKNSNVSKPILKISSYVVIELVIHILERESPQILRVFAIARCPIILVLKRWMTQTYWGLLSLTEALLCTLLPVVFGMDYAVYTLVCLLEHIGCQPSFRSLRQLVYYSTVRESQKGGSAGTQSPHWRLHQDQHEQAAQRGSDSNVQTFMLNSAHTFCTGFHVNIYLDRYQELQTRYRNLFSEKINGL